MRQAEGGAEVFAQVEPVLFGDGMKTSTTLGSNWVPEQRRISSRAWDMGRALR